MVIYTDQDHDYQVKRCAFKSANETWKVLWDLYDNSNVTDSSELVIKEQIDFCSKGIGFIVLFIGAELI